MSSGTVGWIGTGVMGLSMARRLLTAGYSLRIFNRTPTRMKPLIEEGARAVGSPADAAAEVDFVFTMVGYPDDVEAVYFGQDGVFESLGPDTIVIDMTTSRPELAERIARRAEELGTMSLDAPVSGGDIGARNGTLSIMCGGPVAAFEATRPLLMHMGQNIIHHGGAGKGQQAKLCNQIVVAGTMIGVCEALIYGKRAGLDLERMLESISGGAAGCWTLENLAPRILKGDFAPGFFVEHFVKDMEIVLEEAKRLQLRLPGLTVVHELYCELVRIGYAKSGTQALFLALESQNPD